MFLWGEVKVINNLLLSYYYYHSLEKYMYMCSVGWEILYNE